MALRQELTTARQLLRNLVRSRAARRRLANRLRTEPKPALDGIEIAVYFSDASVNLYQIRQWYGPLAELSKRHKVAIISRTPGAMLTLMDESPVPVVYLRRIDELERFVDRQTLKIVFYVNQNAKNFQMFRFGRMWHVFISHGESDKAYMASNQYKSYDYGFVAGSVAVERLRRALWDYDVDRRAIPIGRPQVDHFGTATPYTPDDRAVVFYAPTWEGDRSSMSYGSIASHGEALVDALINSGRHRVIYRPHPRSGVMEAEYRAANRRIIERIAAANAADPDAGHLYDDGGDLGWQLMAADVAITDISAMIYDRLATGKPILVTRPASPDAVVDGRGFLGACEWLTAEQAPSVVEHVDRVQTSVTSRETLQYWSEQYFGDTTPGAATARFHDAVETLIERWHEHAALHAADTAEESDARADALDEDEAPEDES